MKKLNYSKTGLRSQQGMTLIELMITTIILAILATVAVPTMKSLFERKSVFANGEFFVKTIKLARVEAIQRGKTVSVITTSGNGDWSQGWNLQFINDAGDVELIKAFPALPNSPTFTSDDFDGTPVLSLLPTGQASTVGTFEMFYPDCVGNQRLSFNILLSGLMQRGVAAC
jgi:prepilin-type N-terminal cleavage/methylation domain-containing protein